MHVSAIGTAAAAAKSLQSCPTLCDPIDSSPSGSPVPGILWARGEQRLRRLDGGLREESHLEEGSTLERLQSASGNFGGPGVHLPSDWVPLFLSRRAMLAVLTTAEGVSSPTARSPSRSDTCLCPESLLSPTQRAPSGRGHKQATPKYLVQRLGALYTEEQ